MPSFIPTSSSPELAGKILLMKTPHRTWGNHYGTDVNTLTGLEGAIHTIEEKGSEFSPLGTLGTTVTTGLKRYTH